MRLALLHLFHVAGPLACLLGVDHPFALVSAAVLLFFGLFTLFHDALHGALGLGRRANDVVLTLLGAVLLVSGRATRLMHLRHHARPLADDDLEGRGARLGFWQALVSSPWCSLVLPVRAFRAERRHRVLHVVEWMLALATFAAATTTDRGLVTALVFLSLQWTIQLWGVRLPHRPPAWMLGLLRPLLWTTSPLVLGFVLHERHHEEPRTPGYELR